jgi:hypothetical protein
MLERVQGKGLGMTGAVVMRQNQLEDGRVESDKRNCKPNKQCAQHNRTASKSPGCYYFILFGIVLSNRNLLNFIEC